MAARVNYSGLVIAALGFFLTRFTVTLALYEDPVRFFLAGIVPLTLGLGLAAFGVALAVAEVEAAMVRTVAIWAVIGAGTMLVLAVLTLFGSTSGELPALATVRSRAYLSNFLIGGSVGGTLTGLYASLNRRHRAELEHQANRLEILNRILRHEVLNALTVIRGYAPGLASGDADTVAVIQDRSDDIQATIEEVRYLARSARRDGVARSAIQLDETLESSIARFEERHPEVDISLATSHDDISVRADEQLRLVFERFLDHLLAVGGGTLPNIEARIDPTDSTARVRFDIDDELLMDRELALLETGEISEFDDPSSGFDLNLVRLLIESYHGRIETDVSEGGTSVTMVLPRTGTAAVEQRPLPSGVSDVRPAVPHLLVTLAASMIAGIIWGFGSELFGGSVAGIGFLYGTVSPLVGWITHQFHSGVFGFIFAGILSVLPSRYRHHWPTYVVIGTVWGLTLWIGASGVIAPVWLRLLGTPASIPNLTLNSFVAHLGWGVSIGLLTAWGYNHAVPWLVEREWPSVGRFTPN